jgi:shikimate kinase
METIVLIGPIGVGKSTQAKLLAERLGMPRCSYDEVKGKYWKNLGLSKEKAHSIEKEHGVYAMISYMNEFKSKTVCAIINDHPGHIIDFGGGAQTFDEPHQVEMVQQVFEPIINIFLLLPTPDLETNIKSLPGLKEDYPINAYLILHPTNELFAKKFVYTLGKTPEKIADEIISQL